MDEIFKLVSGLIAGIVIALPAYRLVKFIAKNEGIAKFSAIIIFILGLCVIIFSGDRDKNNRKNILSEQPSGNLTNEKAR